MILHTPTAGQRLETWEQLTAHAPELIELERLARGNRRRYGTHEFWCGWSDLKARMARLVGWHAAKPELAGERAYDIAYRHLLDAYELAALGRRWRR